MRSPQDFIHWLEQGTGARWMLRVAAAVLGLLLTVTFAWKQFHGIPDEWTMQQAVTARQLARGAGFTTLVNYPQTYAVMKSRGIGFEEKNPYPELHQPPFYALSLAAVFTVLPAAIWKHVPTAPGGWAPDYAILIFNLLLFWVSVALTARLAARLFDRRAAFVAAMGTAVSVTLWQQTVALSGLPILLVLIVGFFNVIAEIELLRAEEHGGGRFVGLMVAAGVVGGLLFLTEYPAGLVIPFAVAFLGWRFSGRTRTVAITAFVVAALATMAPWLARNVAVSGHPLALAWEDLALKSDDPTAYPSAQRNTAAIEAPAFDLNKLANKGLTGMERNLGERLWSGGGLLLTAFFVAGLAYQFRHGAANRTRWYFAIIAVALLAAQPFFNSGESPRLPAYFLAPLIIVFGAGFLFVLLDSQPALSSHWRWVVAGLLLLQGLPLMRDCLEPRRIHFHFPPYYPNLFMELRRDLQTKFLPGTGVASDVPAGTAWYGQMRVWSKPERLRDLTTIAVDQDIGGLLLTPVTLDRPFFTELAARKEEAIQLTDAGGWGGVYTGLVTHRMPPGFALSATPLRLTDNMVLLVNPNSLLHRGI
ncbi:MAG TPA: hypothetical protein VHD32_04670 [Candidatus Didemnitutus sp.]|nr:hypothetical protein [Candidatus Didemnitutus sp.]